MKQYIISNYEVEGLERVPLQHMIDWALNQSILCVDLETSPAKGWEHYKKAGLDPYTSTIIMLQLGNAETQYAVDLRDVDGSRIGKFLLQLKENNVKLIGQNFKFDLKMLTHHFGVKFRNVACTMLQEMIIHCGSKSRGFSLEKLSELYLGFKYSKTNQMDLFGDNTYVGKLNKQTRKQFRSIGEDPFTYEQLHYGLKDVEFTFKIYVKQLDRIIEEQLFKTVSLESNYLVVVSEMELTGFYVNPIKWLSQYRTNSILLRESYTEIITYIRNLGLKKFQSFQINLFEEDPEVTINLASSQQVIELCKALGIPTQILDKKKSKQRNEDVFKDTVEEKHLKKYAHKFPLIKMYLKYRRYLKAVTTYGYSFLEKHLNPVTGRIHSNFRQVLDTGRSASSSPNLQNIPSEDKFPGFRKCFTNTDNTWLLVCDYSAQESRCMAAISGDENMISFFNTGDGDLHSYTARLMFGIPVRKAVYDNDGNIVVEGQNEDKRQLSKVINFGVPYGMSAHKFSNDFNKSLKESEEFIDKWFKSYPRIKELFAKSLAFTLKNGYILIDTITRRRSYPTKIFSEYKEAEALIEKLKREGKTVPKSLWSKFFTARGVLQRMSQNFIIQGIAASMTKLAAIILYKKIEDHNLSDKIKMVNIVHDEIVLEVDREVGELAKTLVEQSMLESGQVFVKTIKMIAVAMISDTWEH